MNMNDILPRGSHPKALEFPYFPTKQQAVVWRNWEMVPVCRIARALKTGEENILELAKELGLRIPPVVEKQWLKRGYITIIRNNWHLLNYEQLLELLDWTPEELAFTLKEDDFLWHKMGQLKPDPGTVVYEPLSENEKLRTGEIKKLISGHFSGMDSNIQSRPFDFTEGFLNPRPSERRSFGSAEAGEITLDDSWRICNCSGEGIVDVFIDRFISEHSVKYGFNIEKTGRPAGKRIIKLTATANPALPCESHELDIADDCINITSVDKKGLLRALQWIEKQMDIRGGPFVMKGMVKRETRFDLRLAYTYFGIYGDSLLDPETNPYPDGLLAKLSKLGINAVWLQGLLYKLVPFDLAPELSAHREKRIEALKDLVRRAAGYGIGIYLYLNEPRAMPVAFFDRYPDLKGSVEGEFAALCTSQKIVRDYLGNGVKRLFTEVPDLAGIFTITMSENLTNCYSRIPWKDIKCPRCKNRPPHEVIAEVNNIISEAARSVKPDAGIICWTWSWSPDWADKAIDLLDKNTKLMCTSEEAMPTNVSGIRGHVSDYSMSVVGPGERSTRNWEKAGKSGIDTVAKVQFNNTWECSAVPYLPVMNLVERHIKNLAQEGVKGLMLSWTLGGYPSLNLEVASDYYWKQESAQASGLKKIAAGKFGEKAADQIVSAWECFSRALQEFPFDIGVLYCAPQNYGPANLFHEKPTGYRATMIGFPYDDLSTWKAIYPEDIFEKQFEILSAKWKTGIEILAKAGENIGKSNESAFNDLRNIADAVYCHFRSTYHLIAFVRLREGLEKAECKKDRHSILKKILDLMESEIEIVKMLYSVMIKDSRAGYEASNHYYYTLQNLKEKVINCEFMRENYGKKLQQNTE